MLHLDHFRTYQLTMSKLFFLVSLAISLSIILGSCSPIQIDETIYEDRPHFVVQTASATYWYDQAGGGLSRLIDPEGNDWIAFKKDPLSEYPASAAAGFRGLPNFVFQSDDGGAGHPGFDQCTSEIVGENKIRTYSNSGKWQWTWIFHDTYATVTMEKVDTEHAYWFLYEGTPGGSYSPNDFYWGTDKLGYQTELPDYFKEERATGNWQWAYFGSKAYQRTLLLGMQEPDSHSDLLGVLGNTSEGLLSSDGMVVFGFGRQKGAVPLMTSVNNTFYISLADLTVSSSEEHGKVVEKIQQLFNQD